MLCQNVTISKKQYSTLIIRTEVDSTTILKCCCWFKIAFEFYVTHAGDAERL